MRWHDKGTTSIREDGAKVGEFTMDGKPGWWGYPASWKPRGHVEAVGPFLDREEAKAAVDSALVYA